MPGNAIKLSRMSTEARQSGWRQRLPLITGLTAIVGGASLGMLPGEQAHWRTVSPLIAATLVGILLGLGLSWWMTASPARRRQRADEHQLESLFALSQDLLCVIGNDGLLLRSNPAFDAILGFRNDELQGRKLLDLVHPDDHSRTLAALQHLERSEDPQTFANRCRCRDGTIRWLQWRARPHHGEQFLAVARDITAQREAEIAQAVHDTRHRRVFEHVRDGIAVFEAVDFANDFILLDINLAGQRIAAIDRAQALDQRVSEAVPGMRALGLPELLRRVWQTGMPACDPARHYRHKGISRWVEHFVFSLPNREVVVVYKDVTERKLAQDRLRDSEDRFARFMDHLPALAFMKDGAGRHRYLNRALCETFDTTCWLGRTVREVFPGEHGESMFENDMRALAEGSIAFDEQVTDQHGEQRLFRSQKFAVPDLSGSTWLGCIAVEITEQRRKEEQTERLLQENRALARRLIQAQEKEREQIARELHDEIGQSLTGIRADAEAIAVRCDDPALREIRTSANSIGRVARQLQGSAQHLMLQLRPPLLDELGLEFSLAEMFARWRLRHADIRLNVTSRGAVNAVSGNEAIAVYRILQEALTNVARHARADRVDIRLDVLTTGDGYEIRLEIHDDGIGFDPGLRSSRMGLTGMRERAMAAKGSFMLHSASGDGTVLTLTLYGTTAPTQNKVFDY